MSKKKTAQKAATQAAASMPKTPPRGSVNCPQPSTDAQFPERAIICEAICRCDATPLVSAVGFLKQACVSMALSKLDDVAGNLTTIKAEVPYDMTKRPPHPIMSRSNPLKPTGYLPARTGEISDFKPNTGMVRRPDVVIVKNPTKPPTQDNLSHVVEIKFPPDQFSEAQHAAYAAIAGDDAKLVALGPNECGCKGKQKQKQPVKVPVPEKKPAGVPLPKPGALEMTLIGVALVALILDDLLPTGATQADDALIPALAARFAMGFAR